jgi:hypothetical protein
MNEDSLFFIMVIVLVLTIGGCEAYRMRLSADIEKAKIQANSPK